MGISFRSSQSTARFHVSAEGITEDNATAVMSAAAGFDALVLRYVVAYWPTQHRAMWYQRFSGADEDNSRVLMDSLMSGMVYAVRVTALLSDGTNNQAVFNFSTPGESQFGRIRPSAGDVSATVACGILPSVIPLLSLCIVDMTDCIVYILLLYTNALFSLHPVIICLRDLLSNFNNSEA